MVLLVNSVLICVLFLRFRRHMRSPFSGRNFHPIFKKWAPSSSETTVTTCKVTGSRNVESGDEWRASVVFMNPVPVRQTGELLCSLPGSLRQIASLCQTGHCVSSVTVYLRLVQRGQHEIDSYMPRSTEPSLDDNKSQQPHVWCLLACLSTITRGC
jgi:hypothetical protein